MGKTVDLVKTHGVSCGVGAHMLGVVQECEKNKIAADFYIKTFHHHKYDSAATVTAVKGGHDPALMEKGLNLKTLPFNGNHDAMWCFTPEETAEFMKTVTKPWIAFKVMAVGRIPAAGKRLPLCVPETEPISCWPACSTTKSPRTCGLPRKRWPSCPSGLGPGEVQGPGTSRHFGKGGTP